MLIRQTDLEIPDDNPFKNDALNRKELEPPLTQFVTQASGPFVLALDGYWGSGKTTFLKMWKAKLKETGHICLYVNAWKTDFTHDPLVAIIGELSTAIENSTPSGEKGKEIREVMIKIRKIAESLAKYAIPLGIKLLTHGSLDTKDPAMERAIADSMSNFAQDRIKDYESGKSEIEEFRKSLTSLVEEVEKLNPETSAKVVIIIDELDRCRPPYAVQLLERIKHLFDVAGVVFILGIDRSQLNHSIKAIYGSDFDAQGYLRRFIDLDYQLPDPEIGNYCSYLFKRFSIDELMSKREDFNFKEEIKNLRDFLGCLMSAARMSLREQEQTVARLRIVLQTIPPNHYLFPITLSILLFLREWNRNMYNSLVKGEIDSEAFLTQIDELLNIKEVSKKLLDDNKIWKINWIEALLLNGLSEFGVACNRLDNYRETLTTVEPSLDVNKAQQIIDNIQTINSKKRGSGFKITAKRLELTQNFYPKSDSL